MTECLTRGLELVLMSNFLKMNQMNIFKKFFHPVRKLGWALIVAFMVGVHNFYKQEMDSPDSIVSSIEIDSEVDDDRPKD